MQIEALKFLENYKSYCSKGINNNLSYFIYGEEIFFVNKAKDLLLKCAEENNYHQKIIFYITNSSNWDEIFLEINQQGLFAVNKIIELQLEVKTIDKKITNNLNQLITKLSEQISQGMSNNFLIITYPHKLDNKTSKEHWYSYIKNEGLVISSNILYQNQFSNYLKQFSLELNLNFSKDCLDYLCIKNQGNLLSATQEIEKLKLIAVDDSQFIDLNYLNNILENNGLYTVFDLANNILKGDYVESIKVFRLLVEQGVQIVLILWIIAKELRELAIILEEAGIAKTNVQPYVNQKIKWATKRVNTLSALSRLSIEKINTILNNIAKIDHDLKSYVAINHVYHEIELLIYSICIKELKGEKLNVSNY